MGQSKTSTLAFQINFTVNNMTLFFVNSKQAQASPQNPQWSCAIFSSSYSPCRRRTVHCLFPSGLKGYHALLSLDSNDFTIFRLQYPTTDTHLISLRIYLKTKKSDVTSFMQNQDSMKLRTSENPASDFGLGSRRSKTLTPKSIALRPQRPHFKNQ